MISKNPNCLGVYSSILGGRVVVVSHHWVSFLLKGRRLKKKEI